MDSAKEIMKPPMEPSRGIRTQDSGDDVEEFIAILDRIQASRKYMKGEWQHSNDITKNLEKETTESSWPSSFEWEDFCNTCGQDNTLKDVQHTPPANVQASYTANCNNGGDHIRVQRQRGYGQDSVGNKNNILCKRQREYFPVENPPTIFCADPLKEKSLELEQTHKRRAPASFDLNIEEESDLVFTVGLPSYS